MSQIYTSATKIVFIMMAVASIAALFAGKIDPKDFMMLVSMAFAFYFTKSTPNDEKPQV